MSKPSVHVRATFHTDPADPEGPALFRLEAWPLPQDIGKEFILAMERQAHEWLKQAGWSGGKTNLTGKGPMQ